ncbi:MAG: UDP-N-acetylmuramate dehydrogenase [Bacteroidetes bacterium]|nr:UDP-N-acetylmuramate dehydrogenase [Bacteroidota bacterium]
MIKIADNVSLKPYNTFGIEASCNHFVEINSVSDLNALLDSDVYKRNKHLIIGGGSNILLTKNFDGLVIKNNLKGIEVVREEGDYVFVKASAGEVWHEFVQWCIQRNLAGLENLSLIPGCVGASPMQNIGAYGVEIKDVFDCLEAIDLKNGTLKEFTKQACNFGYRESVFKHELKNKFMIVSVTFRLNKKINLNTSYGAINTELESMGVKQPGINDVSQAVINIRSSKLPDPKVMGNAGSFFKNPEVEVSEYERIKKQFPNVVAYPLENGNYKLAAGWLIEQSGLKGYQVGNAAVHDKQALVLVNKGGANGDEIYSLSEHVLQTVFAKFGVKLEREVNII